MKNLAAQMVKSLADVADLERVLEQRKMSPKTMLKLLRSPEGQSQVATRKRLAKIHSEIVAARYTAYAMKKLCAMLEEKDRPELRLNGALKILEAAGLVGKKSAPSKNIKNKNNHTGDQDMELNADEMKKILRIFAGARKPRR